MKLLMSAIAAAALLAPVAVLAQDGCHHGEKTTMSCAEGTAWDEAKQTCAPVVGS
jgi:Chitin binding Peritrophin-A domain